MGPPRSRTAGRLLLVVVIAVTVLLVGVTTLEFPRDRVTVGAIVVGASLVVGSLALPALLLAGWRSQRE